MDIKYKIYCDMDGVITNFDKGYEELTGRDISNIFSNEPSFWEPINKAGYKFWINLEWRPDGKKLWSYIEKYNPIILSAPSRDDDSRIGKHDWIKRELPNSHLILRTAKNKKEFASPTSILIDDRLPNIEEWRNAGGIGIHYTSTEDTIKQLKKLGM